jgi:two-component system, NarL family, nitrate/nitrite response regulator NarL
MAGVEGLRILIVDDLPDFRAAARELLERRGHVVVAAVPDGKDALEAAARLDPDLVLLDMRLENESGIDVARALTAECPGLAVVLMSVADPGSRAKLVEASGARAFILKELLASTDLRTFLGP